ERAQQRNVGGVEPDDTVIALVDVPVPAHRRRENEITLAHRAAAAVDDRRGAVGARSEADGREGVTMWARAVSGIEDGKGRNQIAGGHRLAGKGRVDENERAAFDVVDGDLVHGALSGRLDVRP